MHCSISFFILTILSTLILTSTESHPCTDEFHELVLQRNFSHCQKLPTLGAELGWSNPSFDKARHHIVFQVLFGALMEDVDGGWLAWGVNPGPNAEMVGTRAAIGIKNPINGSISCNTYNVSYETRIGCQLRPFALEEIKCLGFEYNETTDYHMVHASLNLSVADYNVSKLNIVWQTGSHVDEDRPLMHAATLKNVDSVETLNLHTEKATDIAHLKIHLRKVHGILNIIGWGTFLPIGAIIARFFSEFPFKSGDWWLYTHMTCQCVGFTIGVVGWGIGIWLARISPRYVFITHHVFGILIFVFATLQTLAIKFRPQPRDEFRQVWNIYHHFLGYAVLVLIYINIFEGIRILKPENMAKWRLAVIGILIALGTITLILECFTWNKFVRKRNDMKKSESVPPAKLEEEEEAGGTSAQSRNSLTTPKSSDD